MVTKLNTIYIFQLRFGTFWSTTNLCDILITNVFDDVPIEPADIQQDQPPQISNADESIDVFVILSTTHNTSSDPHTPTNTAKKNSSSTTPLTIHNQTTHWRRIFKHKQANRHMIFQGNKTQVLWPKKRYCSCFI